MAESGKMSHYSRFLERMAVHIATFKREHDRRNETEAFDFTASSLFRPKETTFSRILAFLLNPKASHGQKDKFLHIFCEEVLGWDDDTIDARLAERVVVRTEHTTGLLEEGNDRRRIDLTIAFGSQFIVGIEVKVWAKDQPKQVQNYCEYMKQWVGGKEDYLCLYLTPEGKWPDEVSLPDRAKWESQLMLVSWRKDIHGLLDHFASACKAETVTAFIRDIQKYIQRQFRRRTQHMSYEEDVAQHLMDNPEQAKTALDICAGVDALKEKLWKKARKDLDAGLQSLTKSHKGEIEIKPNWRQDSTAYSNLIVVRHADWVWALQFKNTACDGLEIYTHCEVENSKLAKTEFGGRVPADESYTESWFTAAQPWQDMISGEFVEKVIGWYAEAADQADAAIKK
jgi:hypothetical protein